LSQEDYDLLLRCLNREVAAEYLMYRRYAPKMFAICLRYAGNEMEAEDILQNGFLRLFTHLHQFRFKGSLEGWIRKIFVTTAINYYRMYFKFRREDEFSTALKDATITPEILSAISTQELLDMIHSLPPGYRTIFNMYVIEEYNHKEIAGMLGISVGTSKSQLHRAKSAVRQMIEKRGL